MRADPHGLKLRAVDELGHHLEVDQQLVQLRKRERLIRELDLVERRLLVVKRDARVEDIAECGRLREALGAAVEAAAKYVESFAADAAVESATAAAAESLTQRRRKVVRVAAGEIHPMLAPTLRAPSLS